MTIEEIKKKYPYLYETHMHTREGSACGQSSGQDMAISYKNAGYTGVIVTDHNWYGNTAVDRSLPWEEWVDRFFEGYRNVKKAGDEIDLQVFPGYEAGYNGPEFLIYGLTPEDVKKHPELKDATIPMQLEIVRSLSGMVIQAHPYRSAWYIEMARTYPEYVDGVEIINASHSNPTNHNREKKICNDLAIEYAKKQNLPGTAGSDQHSVASIGGGVAFPTKLESIEDYIDRIKSRADYVLTDGWQWFDKEGNVLAQCDTE